MRLHSSRRSSRTARSCFFVLPLLFTACSSSPSSRNYARQIDASTDVSPNVSASDTHHPKRVAIVGAGASGTSAAWFLDRAAGEAAEQLGLDKSDLLSEIVVFDQNDYVGGRTTTVYPYGNTSLPAVELGGSLFVAANKHMEKATKRYGFDTIGSGEGGLGIWDGQDFPFTSLNSSTTSDELFERYGADSFLKMGAATEQFLSRIANLYDPVWLAQHGTSRSIEDFAERAHLGDEYTGRTGEEWATSSEASPLYVGEFLESITRANDVPDIHGLGAAVSTATGGARSVVGGNWRIFEAMLNESGATVRLSTQVRDIVPLSGRDRGKFKVVTNTSSDNGVYDQIFYAAPWYSGLDGTSNGPPSLRKHVIKPIPCVTQPCPDGQHTLKSRRAPYVRLHVTLLTTTRPGADPAFYGLPNTTRIPEEVLTTDYTARSPNSTDSFPPPQFQSITWRHETAPGSGEWLVKIMSRDHVSDEALHALLGAEPKWVHRKEWDAYPELRPRPVYAPVEPVKGVQYLAAQELWVSTMETQTISAREAVARVVEDWWELGYGQCGDGADAWDWSCDQ